MDNRDATREFLASRRAKITPEQSGLPVYGAKRRVPGLRRGEVAMLAGVSVEYYTRLERGNLSGVSEGVLDAVARALQLDDAERAHLFDLARAAAPGSRTRRRPRPAESVRRSVQLTLNAITNAPAFVRNGRMDILAANPLGYALYSDMYAGPARPANHARFIFLDARSRSFYPDWDRAANDTVAILRTEAGRDPYDRGLTDLVGRTIDAERGIPHPVGRAQRAPALHRAQALPPPGGRGTPPDVRGNGRLRRRRAVPAGLQRRARLRVGGRAAAAGQLGRDQPAGQGGRGS